MILYGFQYIVELYVGNKATKLFISFCFIMCIINQLKKVLRGTLCEFYKLRCKEKYIVHKLTLSPLN